MDIDAVLAAGSRDSARKAFGGRLRRIGRRAIISLTPQEIDASTVAGSLQQGWKQLVAVFIDEGRMDDQPLLRRANHAIDSLAMRFAIDNEIIGVKERCL